MKPYTKYKASGVEFIGNIPKHWEVKRLKLLSQIVPSNIDKKSKEDEQKVFLCNYVDVYKNNFIDDTIDFMEATASDLQIEKLLLKENDVIATKDSEDPKDIGIPTLVKQSFDNVVCGYHLTLIRSYNEQLLGNYLYWVMCSQNTSQYFYTLARGITRYALGTNAFNNLQIPLPDIKEQSIIANFLDRKTTELDTLITNKKSLIELLKEERTAIINNAITKGINPNVKFKDSGIEWIGEIPEHWEVKRLKYLVKTNLKYGANESAEFDNPNYPRYIRITDFGNDGKLKDNTFKSLPPEIAKNYLLENGDLLFARSGATVGKTFLFTDYHGEACFAGYLIKATFDQSKINSKYINYFTKSTFYDNWKESMFQQATIQNIGADKYNQLTIPISNTIEEQNIIVEFIETKTTEIDTIISQTEKEIELLKEYKIALISEVVLGKVDVREEVYCD
ncbi:MAG: hypothetical protein RL308_1317 [Bacteroidota bacterium]|jgi:restriction endonuclease S subunit